MRITVRKVKGSGKKYYYAVGRLKEGVWNILTCLNQGIRMQLLYPTKAEADNAAKWIRANKEKSGLIQV